jgi:hypothetical protein
MSKRIDGKLSAVINERIKILLEAGYDQTLVFTSLVEKLREHGFEFSHEAYDARITRVFGKGNRPEATLTDVTEIPNPFGDYQLEFMEDRKWGAEQIRIARNFYERSRAISDRKILHSLRSELQQKLKESEPHLQTANRNMINMFLTYHRAELGNWGMPTQDRLDSDREVMQAFLQSEAYKAGEPYHDAPAYWKMIGSKFSTVLAPATAQAYFKQLGFIAPEFRISKNKKEELPPQVKELVQFAKVWNDKDYAVSHDLENAFGITWVEIWKHRKKYLAFREKHTEFEEVLPYLSVRKRQTGEYVPLPLEVLSQLDVYRFERSQLKNARGLVVVAAQWGAPLNHSFWWSLKMYAEYRGFPLIVMPMKYGPIKTHKHRFKSLFPSEFYGHVIFDDVLVAKGMLQLNVARFRPTLEKHLTDKVCQMGGEVSQIFGAPRLELEHRPRIGHTYSKSIMTTGAVTHPSYRVDPLGQQDRTGEVATATHEYAAIVVEFGKKKREFHFRQLLANKRGEFYDIEPVLGGARFFTEAGHEHKPNAVDTVIEGDWHTYTTDPVVREATYHKKHGLFPKLQPKHVIMHDAMDNDSPACPFWGKQKIRSAFLASLGLDDVRKELEDNAVEIEWKMKHLPNAKYHWVPSNHPDSWMMNWIDSGEWIKDDRNRMLGAELTLEVYRDLEERTRTQKLTRGEIRPLSPIAIYFRKRLPELHVIDRQEPFLRPKKAKHPVVLSLHGDIGPGGMPSRGTQPFLKFNARIILGHNHTATKYLGIWRVGTTTKLMKHYVEAPATSWTNTHGVVFDNGQVMLINIIKGRWQGC